MEKEIDGYTILVVQMIQNAAEKIELDIYKKSINTERFMTADSQHANQHNMSAFNSIYDPQASLRCL